MSVTDYKLRAGGHNTWIVVAGGRSLGTVRCGINGEWYALRGSDLLTDTEAAHHPTRDAAAAWLVKEVTS